MTLATLPEYPCPGCGKGCSTGKCHYCALSLLNLTEPGDKGLNALKYFAELASKRAARIAKGESVLAPNDADVMAKVRQSPDYSAKFQQWQGMVMIEELLEIVACLYSHLARRDGEIEALEAQLENLRNDENPESGYLSAPDAEVAQEDQIEAEGAPTATGAPLVTDGGVSPAPSDEEQQGSVFLLTEDEA